MESEMNSPVRPPPPQGSPGAPVRSRFTLTRKIGRGAVGEVHEGLLHDSDPPRPVAVKILSQALREEEESSFRENMEAISALRHDNILVPKEFIASSAGRVLIYPLLDGLDLRDVQRRLKRLGRPLDFDTAVEIVRQISMALAWLHEDCPLAPKAHLEIRPSNIFLGGDGKVSLLDLGLSSPLTLPTERSKGLAASTVLPYLAPERLSERGKWDGVRSDVYSLGTIFYELLAGRPLFDGSVARRELEIRVAFGVHDKIVALNQIHDGIGPLLERMLALNADERFRSAAEVDAALKALTSTPSPRLIRELIEELQALPEHPLSFVKAGTPAPEHSTAKPEAIRKRLEATTLSHPPVRRSASSGLPSPTSEKIDDEDTSPTDVSTSEPHGEGKTQHPLSPASKAVFSADSPSPPIHPRNLPQRNRQRNRLGLGILGFVFAIAVVLWLSFSTTPSSNEGRVGRDHALKTEPVRISESAPAHGEPESDAAGPSSGHDRTP